MADRLAGSGVTRKEAEVLGWLGEHLSNAEIAAQLYVSERTVETHVSSLLRKLGASNRRELGRLAGHAGALSSAIGSGTVGPSSTMTFLFTHIEDSTASWEHQPSSMPQVIAWHDAALRHAVARRTGRIFATTGDGIGAAFASAPQAVGAAVDAQRALWSAPWPGDDAVRVAMAVHTGTATERDGAYVGGVVNRVTRIAAAGRGGHILLSAATAMLVADEGWTLVDLGAHLLEGLERPERIVRLDAPGVPVVVLPLRASRERAGNLPHPSTAMIGREDELTRLVDLVGRHRLITVTGAGGAGKTRLALAAADELADQFPDGTWFVELGEILHSEDVASAVATTLALQPAGGAGVTSTVAALADQHALLLLDNCEHLIGGVIRFVSAIERCARITVLATSREALGLGHEARLLVPPLGVDGAASAAVCLFRERAEAVIGAFETSDEDDTVVEEICRMLDGLPLAIELATARLSTMNVAELRAHLDDRFAVLARHRGANARHQSLRATVAWSYDLLTEVEQALFDRLSVFGSDFGTDAARAVGGDITAPVEDLLLSLVDKSLLTTTQGLLGTRFRQLETLRQYAEARLDVGGGLPSTMRRHLDHYLAWTEAADAGIKRTDELRWHRGLTSEWSNIRNAVRWACQVDDGAAAIRLVSATLWWTTSRMRLEGEQWCHLVLGLPSAADHPLRPVLAAGAALFAHMRNDADGQRRLLDLARAEEERLGPAGEPWVPAAILNNWNGGPAAALDDVAALRRRSEADGTGIWELRASLEEALILATLLRGATPSPAEEAASIARIEQIVEQAERYGQPSSVAYARASLGTALRASDPMAALTLLEDALDLAAPLGVEETSNTTRCELESHYTQLGRPGDALALVRATIAEHLRVGAWHEVRPALARTGQAFADLGRTRLAATVLGHFDSGISELNRSCLGFPGLDDQLAAELDADDFAALIDDGRSRTLAEVAQLVLESIDGMDE